MTNNHNSKFGGYTYQKPLFMSTLFIFALKLTFPQALVFLRCASAIAHHHSPKMILSALCSTPKSGKIIHN